MNLKFFNRRKVIRAAIAATVIFVGWELSDVVTGLYKVVRTNAATLKPDERHMTATRVGQVSKPVLRFLVFGDSGTGNAAQRDLAGVMEARCQSLGGFDGMLLLGDLVYPDGVTAVDDPLWADRFERPYRATPCLSKVPAYPVLGNHDYLGDPVAWLERSVSNPQWRFPARSWALTYPGLLTVTGVDSTHPWLGGLDGLRSSTPRGTWRIALGHHPLESSSDAGGRHRGGGIGGTVLRRALCGEVDVYLSGHAHHLEHRRIPDCRIEHFIAGGAGAGLTGVSRQDGNVAFAAKSHGFLELTVTRRVLVFRFINTNGKTLYRTRIVGPDSSGESSITDSSQKTLRQDDAAL